MATVKLDENVPDSVGTILREAGHEVALARNEQLAGAPDERLLAVASGDGRVLVSFDRGFGSVIQHPPPRLPSSGGRSEPGVSLWTGHRSQRFLAASSDCAIRGV